MNSTEFVYWLNGLYELTEGSESPIFKGFTPNQASIIRDHLKLVLTKVTPQRHARPSVLPEPTYCSLGILTKETDGKIC